MKAQEKCWYVAALLLVAVMFGNQAMAQPNWGTNENFSAIGQAVVKLLESGDAPGFARALSPSMEDWQAANATNHVSPSSLERTRRTLETSARQLLAKTAALKVDFAKVRISVTRSVPPRFIGGIRYEGMKDSLPHAEQLAVVLAAEPLPNAADATRLGGEYKVILRNLIKFPSGWRCNEGIQWAAFPTTVADEKVQRETAILEKAASSKGLKQEEDPALGKLAEVFVRCIREHNIQIFETEGIISLDELLAMMKKDPAEDGEKQPPRTAMEKQYKLYKNDLLKPASAVLKQLEEGGIDLKDADITVKAAEFKSLYPRGGAGVLDGLEGKDLQIAFTVKSDAKSKTGKSLSGEYVLGAEECLRKGDRWFVSENLHWKSFPAGVLEEKAAAAVEFERYVAEHNTLPLGSVAPDIEFVRMADEQKMKLADLRGKVVLLDFWDVACGPCQGPLAELQKLRDTHADWSNRVELITLSIDDALKTARNHLEKRGWTNTFNAWAGRGGWKAVPAQKFRVTGIPTTYIIDSEGKIIEAGHPAGMQIPERINELLAKPRPKP